MPTNVRITDLYAVWTNNDLTEGRGTEHVKCLTSIEATAIRVGKKGYVQGSDCRYTKVQVFRVSDGVNTEYHLKQRPATFVESTEDDFHEQKRIDQRRDLNTVLDRAKVLGLTDEEIGVLRGFK